MSAVLAQSVVLPALPQRLEAHPELEIELSGSDPRVDLVHEGFDGVIRLGPIVDETLTARPLGNLRMTHTTSAGYLARFGVPHTFMNCVIRSTR